jgi:hypothetical protein
MKTEVTQFELYEASIHLQELLAELSDGKITESDAPALSVQMAHIMDHLCRAWNCKDLSPKDHADLSQVEFERLSHTIPNFMGELILGEFALC